MDFNLSRKTFLRPQNLVKTAGVSVFMGVFLLSSVGLTRALTVNEPPPAAQQANWRTTKLNQQQLQRRSSRAESHVTQPVQPRADANFSSNPILNDPVYTFGVKKEFGHANYQVSSTVSPNFINSRLIQNASQSSNRDGNSWGFVDNFPDPVKDGYDYLKMQKVTRRSTYDEFHPVNKTQTTPPPGLFKNDRFPTVAETGNKLETFFPNAFQLQFIIAGYMGKLPHETFTKTEFNKFLNQTFLNLNGLGIREVYSLFNPNFVYPKLEVINLSENAFEYFPVIFAQNFPNLYHIKADNSHIKFFFNSGPDWNNRELFSLSLKDNQLQYFPNQEFRMRNVFLSNNRIRMFFKQKRTSNTIDLRGNQLLQFFRANGSDANENIRLDGQRFSASFSFDLSHEAFVIPQNIRLRPDSNESRLAEGYFYKQLWKTFAPNFVGASERLNLIGNKQSATLSSPNSSLSRTYEYNYLDDRHFAYSNNLWFKSYDWVDQDYVWEQKFMNDKQGKRVLDSTYSYQINATFGGGQGIRPDSERRYNSNGMFQNSNSKVEISEFPDLKVVVRENLLTNEQKNVNHRKLGDLLPSQVRPRDLVNEIKNWTEVKWWKNGSFAEITDQYKEFSQKNDPTFYLQRWLQKHPDQIEIIASDDLEGSLQARFTVMDDYGKMVLYTTKEITGFKTLNLKKVDDFASLTRSKYAADFYSPLEIAKLFKTNFNTYRRSLRSNEDEHHAPVVSPANSAASQVGVQQKPVGEGLIDAEGYYHLANLPQATIEEMISSINIDLPTGRVSFNLRVNGTAEDNFQTRNEFVTFYAKTAEVVVDNISSQSKKTAPSEIQTLQNKSADMVTDEEILQRIKVSDAFAKAASGRVTRATASERNYTPLTDFITTTTAAVDLENIDLSEKFGAGVHVSVRDVQRRTEQGLISFSLVYQKADKVIATDSFFWTGFSTASTTFNWKQVEEFSDPTLKAKTADEVLSEFTAAIAEATKPDGSRTKLDDLVKKFVDVTEPDIASDKTNNPATEYTINPADIMINRYLGTISFRKITIKNSYLNGQFRSDVRTMASSPVYKLKFQNTNFEQVDNLNEIDKNENGFVLKEQFHKDSLTFLRRYFKEINSSKNVGNSGIQTGLSNLVWNNTTGVEFNPYLGSIKLPANSIKLLNYYENGVLIPEKIYDQEINITTKYVNSADPVSSFGAGYAWRETDEITGIQQQTPSQLKVNLESSLLKQVLIENFLKSGFNDGYQPQRMAFSLVDLTAEEKAGFEQLDASDSSSKVLVNDFLGKIKFKVKVENIYQDGVTKSEEKVLEFNNLKTNTLALNWKLGLLEQYNNEAIQSLKASEIKAKIQANNYDVTEFFNHHYLGAFGNQMQNAKTSALKVFVDESDIVTDDLKSTLTFKKVKVVNVYQQNQYINYDKNNWSSAVAGKNYMEFQGHTYENLSRDSTVITAKNTSEIRLTSLNESGKSLGMVSEMLPSELYRLLLNDQRLVQQLFRIQNPTFEPPTTVFFEQDIVKSIEFNDGEGSLSIRNLAVNGLYKDHKINHKTIKLADLHFTGMKVQDSRIVTRGIASELLALNEQKLKQELQQGLLKQLVKVTNPTNLKFQLYSYDDQALNDQNQAKDSQIELLGIKVNKVTGKVKLDLKIRNFYQNGVVNQRAFSLNLDILGATSSMEQNDVLAISLGTMFGFLLFALAIYLRKKLAKRVVLVKYEKSRRS